MEFDPDGRLIATFDRLGVCAISNVFDDKLITSFKVKDPSTGRDHRFDF